MHYLRTTSEEALANVFDLQIIELTGLPTSKSILPGEEVLAVRLDAESKERRFSRLHWGLVRRQLSLYGAKPQKNPFTVAEVKSETVAANTNRNLRHAYLHQRCLIPADGFYESKKLPGSHQTQKYFINMKDGSPFAFAGIWENWKPFGSEEIFVSCAIATTSSNQLCAEIQDRMPVILPAKHYQSWLDGSAGEEVLVPYPADKMNLVVEP